MNIQEDLCCHSASANGESSTEQQDAAEAESPEYESETESEADELINSHETTFTSPTQASSYCY